MTTREFPLGDMCRDCLAWVKLSEADGGIGICDNTLSEHSQHIIGFAHPVCKRWMRKLPVSDMTYEAEEDDEGQHLFYTKPLPEDIPESIKDSVRHWLHEMEESGQ